MTMLGEAERVRLWIAFGDQPGLSAAHAVWLWSRFLPRAAPPAPQPEPKAAPAPRPTRRVRAGTQAYQEQLRP